MTEFEILFLERYPDKGLLLEYMKDALMKELNFHDITKTDLERVVRFIRSSVASNSARTYCAHIKSFMLRHQEKMKALGKDWTDILTVRKESTIFVTLDESEIKRLIKYAINEEGYPMENRCVAMFCVSAITGARYSDMINLKGAILKAGEVFSYVSEKTKIRAEILVAKSLPLLLSKITKVHRRDILNRNIKNVCRKLGFKSPSRVFRGGVASTGEKWEFVSSHTARRSFATNMWKQGADLEYISLMMGHASYNQTKGYINSSIEDVSDNIKNLFNNY